ncbi:hypothetical protein J4573_16340 [Actinomadura barringtoniae]|uniref:Uncharacterized protein n=1 Tax=Actinomadura barringtoniae TaxID=1427535 RepID=A0A939T6V1_9ACTN|nr:hypothetical protein [Actinomadura barringtoniae]MBO2448672.1 hypothetical protein [Actinomadura barringtoniae]
MTDNLYPVGVSIKRDALNGSGFIATVEGGHPKVRYLFAFGDSRRAAGRALAKLIYETLDNSRFDLSKVGSIALIEARVIPLRSLTASDEDQSGDKQ